MPLSGLDIALIGVLVLSTLVGLWRGFTFELLSLAGWFVAYFAASWLGPLLAPHLPIGEAGTALNGGAAFASAFIVVLICWSLLARAVSALIGATPLRPLDRLLGAGFGLVRGLVVLLAVATLVAFTPLVDSALWRQSTGAALLSEALRALWPLMPSSVPVPARRV